MRQDSLIMNFGDRREVIKRIFIPLVGRVRREVSWNFGAKDGENKDYRGLCDVTVIQMFAMFKENIAPLLDRQSIYYNLKMMHGEQKHRISLPTMYWAFQHTWARITIADTVYYVDPTASQFMDIYDDIPRYYISTHPPKWYYPDTKNPRFNKPWSFFEKRVKIPTKDYDGSGIRVPCIEYLQYFVWGGFAEWARVHIHHKE